MNLRQWVWGVGMTCWIAAGSAQACDNTTGTSTRSTGDNVGFYELDPYSQLWYLVDSYYEPGAMYPEDGDYVEYLDGPGGGGGGGSELQNRKGGGGDVVQDCTPILETVTAVGHSIPGSGNFMIRRFGRSGGGGFVRMSRKFDIPMDGTLAACNGNWDQNQRESYASAQMRHRIGTQGCFRQEGIHENHDIDYSGQRTAGRYHWNGLCGGSTFMIELSPPVCN